MGSKPWLGIKQRGGGTRQRDKRMRKREIKRAGVPQINDTQIGRNRDTNSRQNDLVPDINALDERVGFGPG